MTTGGVLVQERGKMADLVVILKMLEDPKTRLLAIFDLICKRFAPFEDQHRLGGVGDDEDTDMNIWEAYPAQLVQVADFRNQHASLVESLVKLKGYDQPKHRISSS